MSSPDNLDGLFQSSFVKQCWQNDDLASPHVSDQIMIQDGLLEGPARVNDPMNYRGLYGVWIARPEEAPPGWNGLGTVTISKVWNSSDSTSGTLS